MNEVVGEVRRSSRGLKDIVVVLVMKLLIVWLLQERE